MLLDGILPLVERALPFVQFLANLGEFFFPFGLLLDGLFFDFQLGFFFAILGLAVGLFENAASLRLCIAASQPIEQPHDAERQPAANHRHDYDHDGF